MRLVENAKDAWRWFSVQFAAVLAVLPLAWANLPADVKVWVPEDWRPWILAGLALAVIFGRLIDQEEG